MGNSCERAFFTLYPSNRKKPLTEEGVYLRKIMALATFVHFGLSILALAAIGFWPMLINLIQSSSAYSCYLTLRERQVWVYMIFLVIQVWYQIMDLCSVGDDPNKRPDSAFEMMGNLISLALSCVMGYMVGRASYIFRKTGGLHGSVKDGATPLLIED